MTLPGHLQDSKEPIKSLPSRDRAFVRFVNRSTVPVDIIWRGFNGEHVRYYTRLGPQRHFSVNTFELHPWQVWNSNTLQLLHVGGGLVFYPRKWNGEGERSTVYIDAPVFTLVRLCLEKIKSLVSLEDVDQLQIPRVMAEELKRRKTVEIQDYVRL